MDTKLSAIGATRLTLGLRMAAVATGLFAMTSPAAALWDDQLELFVSESVLTDSNIFRVSRDRDPNTFLGSSSKSDTYNTTTFGFNLDVPVSRQRFQAGSSWNQVKYNRFSDLDHIDRDGRVKWLWQLGDLWSGQLGYAENRTLASFSNFQGRNADPLKTQRAFGEAAYLLTPSWQLQAGVSDQTQRNGNAIRRDNDVDLFGTEFRVNYISAADNKIGLSARQEDGRYPNRQLVAGTLFDNAYVQRSLGVATDWAITGKSHLNARVDRVRRSYDQLAQRDYSGTTFRAAYDWLATGKLALTTVAQRDIGASADIRTSFVLIKGIALTPSFEASDKIKLSATIDSSIRDYLGDPGLALGIVPGRSDRVRTVSALISYRPMRSLTLLLSGQRESRTSNVPLTDYTAGIVGIQARLAF